MDHPVGVSMTTLADAMLETAKLVTDVFEGVGSVSSTTSEISDASLKYPAGTFNGGTVWSPKCDKGVADIKTQGQNTFTMTTTQTLALTGPYQIADSTFPMYKLKQAALYVLGKIEIPTVNTALSAGSGSVQINDGSTLLISNVRQVFVDDVRNYHWRELNGYIYFDDPSTEGALDIYYMSDGVVADYDDILSDAIDMNYLTWSAAVYLWRDTIRKIRKDNPTAQELLNEAKVNEADALRQARKYAMRRMPRDPHFARW